MTLVNAWPEHWHHSLDNVKCVIPDCSFTTNQVAQYLDGPNLDGRSGLVQLAGFLDSP